MTDSDKVEPAPLSERTSTYQEVEDEEDTDAKTPLDAKKHPSRRESSLRESSDDPKHLGTKAVEGNPKEKLQRIKEAKEKDL